MKLSKTAAAGALMVAASASSLFVIVVAIQLAGASGYFLAGFKRVGVRPSEAAVKWLFSSLSSGVFLLVGALLGLLAGVPLADAYGALLAG